MNWNQIESNWKQLKGNIQQQWAELTEDDLDNMSGNREELTGKLQQTYGFDKQRAESEIDVWQNSQEDLDADNDMIDNSNTMHTNKFGYDESSSNNIQSGDDNDNKVGTNNVSADGTHSSTGNRLTGTISLNSSAKRANHDAPHIDGLNSQSNSIANTNDVDMNDLTAGNDQALDEYNPSNDDSQGPGDAGGIPGENDEDDMDDDIDEFNHPNPSPMPDSLNRNNQDKNQDNETPHQEKSIDQT